MIPSENELARIYGISRVTARTVVKNLVSDGLLYRVQGKGTFVAKPKIITKGPAWGGVSRLLEEQGMSVTTKQVEFSIVKPSISAARKLNISLDTDVRYICRVRYADGIPVCIHKNYIPLHLCESLTVDDLKKAPLCDNMRTKMGLAPDIIHETLETTRATEFEADLLGIKPGEVIIIMEATGELEKGLVFQFSKILFRGDKMKLRFDYRTGANSPITLL